MGVYPVTAQEGVSGYSRWTHMAHLTATHSGQHPELALDHPVGGLSAVRMMTLSVCRETMREHTQTPSSSIQRCTISGTQLVAATGCLVCSLMVVPDVPPTVALPVADVHHSAVPS